MSRAIGSFLILIVAVQQIICQDDFQDFVRAKLEKLENEKAKLSERVVEITSHLQSMDTEFQNYKLKSKQELTVCKENFQEQGESLSKLNHDLNNLQDIGTSLTTAKSCWQLGMQGITRSGNYNVDPDGSYSGDKPFLVQCLFPDNSTIIGEEVEIEIEKCIAEQCFEASINYTMPVEQMQKLFGISGRCTQTLDFHCKTAPLQSRQGAPLFTWTDTQGIQHTLPGSNCNQNAPVWKKDSIEITDLASLPIKKISYGPLVYETEEAKVVISALTCEPPALEKWPEYTTTGKFRTVKTDLNERFEALELQINETIIELKKGINECQTDPCQNQGICSDIQNGYTCTCVPGFTGTNCEVNFDDCSRNPCLHGMCTDLINSYKCACETGYHGSNCDSQTPPLPDQCSNYKKLTSSKRRFDQPTSGSSKCDITGISYVASDWDGEGWYRVEGSAGSQLSENYSSWTYYRCGSSHGGHVTGGHPAIAGQTVTRTVCFNPSCTGREKRLIKVTNCNGYYVYHLPEVVACNRGYCTE